MPRSAPAYLVIGALALSTCGCGLMAQQQRREALQAAQEAAKAGLAACKAQYPETSGQAVARNKCGAQAALPLRAFSTDPDLFDQMWAYSAVIAEKLDHGQLTVAEAKQLVAEKQSAIIAEAQRRNVANRSVAAQEAVAMEATMPVICNRVGTTTICN